MSKLITEFGKVENDLIRGASVHFHIVHVEHETCWCQFVWVDLGRWNVKSSFGVPMIYRDISDSSRKRKSIHGLSTVFNLLCQHNPNVQLFSFRMDMAGNNLHDRLILMVRYHASEDFVVVRLYQSLVNHFVEVTWKWYGMNMRKRKFANNKPV